MNKEVLIELFVIEESIVVEGVSKLLNLFGMLDFDK